MERLEGFRTRHYKRVKREIQVSAYTKARKPTGLDAVMRGRLGGFEEGMEPPLRKKMRGEKEQKTEAMIKKAQELKTSREMVDDFERVYQLTKDVIQYKNPFSVCLASEHRNSARKSQNRNSQRSSKQRHCKA